MKMDEGLQRYSKLNREEYFEKNQELSEKLWEKQNLPTVYDIAEFILGNENEKMNKIFDFFENKEEFTKMATRTNSKYEQEESSGFIQKVMSANNEDIAKAGYFYKLLMASADDFLLDEGDCKASGLPYIVDSLTEETYNYRIKSTFIEELADYAELTFQEFMETLNKEGIKEIHVRTPINCNYIKEFNENGHVICKKCAGILPDNTENIGAFTTLMVTEHATQSALSSMNKGIKENINDLIALRYDGPYNIDNIIDWIIDLTEKLKNDKVQSRFYEIALISRIRFDEEGPFVSSLKGSINYSSNLFGAYIFTANHKHFEKIIRAKSFNDNSLKLKIAINQYKK